MKRRAMLAAMAAIGLLAGCGGAPAGFKNTDLSDGKIFPRLELLDVDGRPRNLEEFRGKVVIVLFGYTRCPDLCPSALRKYASLIRNLRSKDAERVQLLFVTLDPDRDTPAQVGTYARWFSPNFIGLGGPEATIADVAAQFRVSYRKQPVEGSLEYTLDHTVGAYLIDPQGQLRVFAPENALIEPIAEDVRQLLALQK